MTELNDDEALILAQARVGLGPTSADEQRVLQGVRAQLALGAVGTTAQNPTAGVASSKSPWPMRIAGSIAVIGAVALSGGLGYRRGFQAGIAQKNQPDTRANRVNVPSAAIGETLAPASSNPGISASNPTPAIERELRAERDAKATSASARAPSVSAAPSAGLGLDEEVRQLRRVERAIREGNPRFALGLLDELDRAIPAGQLLEERRAASIMANCQLGSGDAARNARAFASKHAGSAYLTRVIEICGLGKERNSAAPGTNAPSSGG